MAGYRVRILEAASRDLERLDKPTGRRIVQRIHWLAANLEALAGDLAGFYKLRVGDYRVISVRAGGGLACRAAHGPGGQAVVIMTGMRGGGMGRRGRFVLFGFLSMGVWLLPVQLDVRVRDLVRDPDRFDGKVVRVSGIIARYQERVSRRGRSYTRFRLEEGGFSVRVFAWGHRHLRDGQRVRVTGRFDRVKRVGWRVFRAGGGSAEDRGLAEEAVAEDAW